MSSDNIRPSREEPTVDDLNSMAKKETPSQPQLSGKGLKTTEIPSGIHNIRRTNQASGNYRQGQKNAPPHKQQPNIIVPNVRTVDHQQNVKRKLQHQAKQEPVLDRKDIHLSGHSSQSQNQDNKKSLDVDQVQSKIEEANGIDEMNIKMKRMSKMDSGEDKIGNDMRVEVEKPKQGVEDKITVEQLDSKPTKEQLSEQSHSQREPADVSHEQHQQLTAGIKSSHVTSETVATDVVSQLGQQPDKTVMTQEQANQLSAKPGHDDKAPKLATKEKNVLNVKQLTKDPDHGLPTEQTSPSTDDKGVLLNEEPSQLGEESAGKTDTPVESSRSDLLEGSNSKVSDANINLPSVSLDKTAEVEMKSDKEAKPSVQDKDEEQPEIIKVPKASDDNLPSFDEWKQKMLAEQAEQEKTKNQEVQTMQPISATPSNNKKGSKKVNYASVTCGAKVRASNPEAQHPDFILTENRDQYMINPCKAKKWFVVELCTPVQIQALEIGNLELFSSLPESFLVQISEGFPTKDWKPIGTFHARDERSVQSFMVDNEQMYAHYIRIEMLSHYGNEHYCPLTVLRVFGLTVIEADEEAEEEEEVHIPEDTDEIPIQDTEKDATLFSSATDTVISLVKTMLSQGKEEGTSTEEMDSLSSETLTDAVHMKTDVVNASVNNVTSDEMAREQTEPCVPEVRSKQEPVSVEQHGPPTEPQIPDVTVDNIVFPVPEDSLSADHVIPEGDEDDAINIVTLIECPQTSISEYLLNCHYCVSDTQPACYADRQSICGYYKILSFVPLKCCVNPSHREEMSETAEGHSDLETMSTEAEVPATAGLTKIKISLEAATVEPAETFSLTPSTKTDEESLSSSQVVTPPLTSVQYTDNLVQTESVSILSPSTVSQSVGIASTKQEVMNDVKPKVEDVRPSVLTVDTTVMATETSTDQSTRASVEPTGVKTVAPQSEVSSASESSDSGSANGLPDIYAEDASNQNADSDLEPAPPPSGEDIQYQKLTIAKKETTFMKLKNKIRSLELNLNLSSQYLEQLSQRYKKQMEEMYISLNRTITKLADTSRKAEEKDIKQQEHIADLQRQITALNLSFESLQGNMSAIHLELIERHLYLMMVEAVVFLLVLAWCLHRQEKNVVSLQRKHTRSTQHTASDGNTVKVNTIKGQYKRRNSADGTPHNSSVRQRCLDDCDIKKSGSESDITRILPSNLGISQTGLQQGENTRKKKKKRSNKSSSFGHLVGMSLTNAISTSCHSTNSPLCMDTHRTAPNSCGAYTAHALKKPDANYNKSQHMNGHVAGHLTTHDQVTDDVEESDVDRDLARRHSLERLIKQKTFHRKTSSLDRNLYSVLSVSKVDECNGHLDSDSFTFPGYSQSKATSRM